MINSEFIHKYTRRKIGHDYYSPCHYHVILRKALACQDYGRVKINPGKSYGDKDFAYIEHIKLGKIICGNIWNLGKEFRQVSVNKYCVMPDHVHIFLWIKERSDRHLGDIIGKLKFNITQEYSRYCGKEISHHDIFEENYTDKIVYLGRNFDVIREYIRTNPDRLAIRLQKPEFFQRKVLLELAGERYEAYGNLSLLENPFKMAVRVHRRNTDALNEQLKERWLEHVVEGGVLVSPFYSKKEKNIREIAEMMGGRIIMLDYKAFPEKFKPSKHEFDLCTLGKMLLISPEKSFAKELTYPVATKLNDLAEQIASMDFRGIRG